MIEQYNINVIVTLTELVEKGKVNKKKKYNTLAFQRMARS